MNQAIDYHAILPELILAGTILLVLVVDVFLPARAEVAGRCPSALVGTLAALVATLTLIGDAPHHVRRHARRRQLRDPVQDLLPVGRDRGAAASRSGTSARAASTRASTTSCCSRSFLGCVMMPSSRDLLMLFISLELVSAPGFLMAAFRKSDPQVERGRPEVLPDRRAVDRRDALRHEPDLRAHGHHAAGRDRAGAGGHRRRRRRRSRSRRSCSSSSGSRSRCPRCRSSSGRPTRTRARRCRSRRSWRSPRTRPGSPGCCS